MPPRVTKKPKVKKQKSTVPDDFDFMLGEEISVFPNDDSSLEQTEYPIRDAFASMRFVGDAGHDTSRDTDSTISRSGQLANSIGNITRLIPEAIPEESESRTIGQPATKSKVKRKDSAKNKGSSNRRRSLPVDGSTHESMQRGDTEEWPPSSSNASSTTAGKHPSHRSHSDTTPPSADPSIEEPLQRSSNASSASHSTKASSSHRRKSSPTKKTVSGKKGVRQTIANDRDIKLIQEVQRLQASTHCLIPKLPFARLIREIILAYCGRNLYITPECLQCLQEAAEIYAVQVIEDAYRCTLHRGRITLCAKDMRLALLLRNDSVAVNMV